MKTPAIIIACTTIEAMMHGATHFRFAGRNATAFYSDGTQETAEVPAAMADAVKAYYDYQENSGGAADCPSTFSMISEIQSKRGESVYATEEYLNEGPR